MQIENFENFEECCKKATLAYFEKWRDEKEDTKNELSEKAYKIKNFIIEREFECQTQNVLDLMSIVIEEDLGSENSIFFRVLSGEGKFSPLPGVVFIFRDRSDKIFISSRPKYFINEKGRETDDEDYSKYADYFPPTEDEFKLFFQKLKILNRTGKIDGDLPVLRIMEEYL